MPVSKPLLFGFIKMKIAYFALSCFAVCAASAQTFQWIKPALPLLPPERANGSLVYDSNSDQTILFGGNVDNVAFNDTWAFSKALGWIQLNPTSSPSPRSGAGFVYDPISRTAVLFGGNAGGGSCLDDTWTWDGKTWTQQFPPVSPPPRGNNTQQMAYHAFTNSIVLFGGAGPGGELLNDTWTWHGRTKTWTQRFPATSPSPRTTTLTYDATNQQTVLFGGFNNNGFNYLDDTWTWDGLNWTQRFPATVPPARANNALAYDATSKRVVMFGGYFNDGPGDTWTWNGVNWTQIQTSFTPRNTFGSWFTFDPRFRGLVLFGGWIPPSGPYINQTWIFRMQ